MRSLAIILAVTSILQLQGCAQIYAELQRDPRDAPWDPKPGSGISLMDQLPPWDYDPNRRICAGHKAPDQRLPHQTGRC